MNVILIYFLLIIFLSNIYNSISQTNDKIISFELNNNNISIIKGNFEFYINGKEKINLSEIILSSYMNDSIFNSSLINIKDEILIGDDINYMYVKYQEIITQKIMNISTTILEENINFKFVNVTYNKLGSNNFSILSLNNIDDKLILYNYIDKRLIIENYTNFLSNNEIKEEEKKVLQDENLCHNKTLILDENKKFVCKLDFILLGHEDLPKDDVYLAKQIDDKYSVAYFDNMLSYSIFPYEYLEYFFTSFFSELNDGCTKQIYETDVEGKEKVNYYYITCPKKKIDIYTKRRKLSLIMNKFSYPIENLFVDSFDFLNIDEINTDNYYFNILFEQDRTNFVLGFGFLSKMMFLNYNHSTYIYSKDRINYTEDLTDNSSENFEKWLYILTACSFTLVLLIFTIVGCFHSRKIKSELNQMLSANIK